MILKIIAEGVETVDQKRLLTDEGIRTNVTLVFSPLQALMAAKAGATYVSPFVGRLDDLAEEGMVLVEQIDGNGRLLHSDDGKYELAIGDDPVADREPLIPRARRG